MIRTLVLMLAMLVAGGLQAREPIRALIGATLVNPADAPVADAVVLVRDGRVIAAGPRAEVAIPAGSERVDMTGKWLVPGYIDAHVHFFQSGGAVHPARRPRPARSGALRTGNRQPPGQSG